MPFNRPLTRAEILQRRAAAKARGKQLRKPKLTEREKLIIEVSKQLKLRDGKWTFGKVAKAFNTKRGAIQWAKRNIERKGFRLE
jgi:hypothetical protein